MGLIKLGKDGVAKYVAPRCYHLIDYNHFPAADIHGSLDEEQT